MQRPRTAPRLQAVEQFPLRSIIFYQGESDSGFSRQYGCLLRALIEQSLGGAAHRRNTSFVYTIIAGREKHTPGDGTLPYLREAQLQVYGDMAATYALHPGTHLKGRGHRGGPRCG